MKLGTKIITVTISIICITLVTLALFSFSSLKQILTDQMINEVNNQITIEMNSFASNQNTLEILKQSLKRNYLTIAKAVREKLSDLEQITPETLSQLVKNLKVSEIHVMNGEGILEISNNDSLVGFDFNSSDQSRVFLEAIKNKNFELAQEPAHRGADNILFMYTGVARLDQPGMIQVGFEPEEYQMVLNSIDLQHEVDQVQFAKSGFVFIGDPDRKVIAYPNGEYKDQNLDETPFGKYITHENEGSFTYKLDQDAFYGAFKKNESGYVFGAIVNTDDYYKSLNQLITNLIVTGLILIFLSTGLILTFTYFIVKRPTQQILIAMQKVGDGNLTHRINIRSKDEIGRISKEYNVMTSYLHDLILNVLHNTQQVASTSEQLTAGAEETSKAAEQISTSIQQIASGLENQVNAANDSISKVTEIAKEMNEISIIIQQANQLSTDASSTADNGNILVNRMIEQMNQISEKTSAADQVVSELGRKSKEISNITTIISDIAQQTNLLALNATIEAARAGEHGRGFAIVADEVRKLAEQSDHAASQIINLIKEIQLGTENAVIAMNGGNTAVKEGNTIVNFTGNAFAEIIIAVNNVSAQMELIFESIQKLDLNTKVMEVSTNHITKISSEALGAAQNVASAAEEQSATMEEISAASYALAKMTENLHDVVSKFKI